MEKNELLELKLLSTNPALDDEGQDRKGLSTKELIRRDKKRFRHIKKEDIEAEVPSHQAQHLLNSVCAKLDIPVMNELMSGVDDIVRASTFSSIQHDDHYESSSFDSSNAKVY